jgi:septal ring factor EnvC (AmiA/AmiB activator)
MASDLRHKTPEQLRTEIAYQEKKLSECDFNIPRTVWLIEDLSARLKAAEASLSKQRMTRNNHHQRLVWAKNYLLMRGVSE